MLHYCGASALSVFRSNQQSTIPALQVPLRSTSGIDSNKHNQHIARLQALEFSANDLGSEATVLMHGYLHIISKFGYQLIQYIKRLRCGHPQGLSQQLSKMPETEFGMMCWGGRVRHHATVPHAETHETLPSSDHPWWPEPCSTTLITALHLDLSSTFAKPEGPTPCPSNEPNQPGLSWFSHI